MKIQKFYGKTQKLDAVWKIIIICEFIIRMLIFSENIKILIKKSNLKIFMEFFKSVNNSKVGSYKY